MRQLTLLLLLFTGTSVLAQKPITIADMQDWNRLTNEQISADGRHILYTLTKDVGDPTAVLYNTSTKTERRLPRLHRAELTYDGRHLIGLLKPAYDTTRQIKLRDKKKAKDKLKDMDSLLVWDLSQPAPVVIPKVYGYKIGDRTAKSYAYTTASALPDSLRKGLDKDAKRLVVRNFTTRDSFYLEGVMDYVVSRDAPAVLAHRTDKDSTWQAGIHYLDTRQLEWQALLQDSLDYEGLTLTHDGTQAAFLTRERDPDDKQLGYNLHHWRIGGDKTTVADLNELTTSYQMSVSADYTPRFSFDGEQLFFGTRGRRLEKDTTLLDDEIADVEIWTTEDARLYTQENVRLSEEKKRTYLAVLDLADGTARQLATTAMPYAYTPPEMNGRYVAIYDDRPYAKETMWEGFPGARNTVVIDTKTGRTRPMLDGQVTPARFLEGGDYLIWYNQTDTTWNSFDASNGEHHVLTTNATGVFYDEVNDRPMHPRSYGYAGTLEGGRKFLVNDRYDIWELDAAGREAPRRVTRGREASLRYFLRDLDREERFIDPSEKQLVETFNQDTYAGGFGWLDMRSGTYTAAKAAPKSYGDFAKARQAEAYIYSESDFRQYPDLQYTTDLSRPATVISDANPQQNQFNWGTAERYQWVDNQGRTLSGLLIKPDGFDPNKQYPLLVNFYERNSEGLYRHRTPVPGRSSINYPHYVSKGYVIFNPDVIYRIGYPGESAYDCVMSGVTSLISEGFIDRKRIGAQGHSWGGYQVAYLATRTDLFAAIESGAPVVNMFSAYGGIRWGSGLSRQFQYERTQSRIGGSPWEFPLRYMENSPIFTSDKINTPILILHNDEDGAVPWYQGIEWYTALRRLGKKAWLLNYRGEPHWPVKTPNRADFQTRMEQFFDHYLMGGDLPVWMDEGVAPLERGLNMGLEPASDKGGGPPVRH